MGLNLIAIVLAVVAFKDAAKIRSWDAWDDHKAPVAWNEKPCVTREKLLKMDPGLEPWGWLETRGAKDVKSSWWSVGCETLDRDYADWDQYKFLLAGLGVKHARFFSGWAKTEQEKRKYDFTWLDPQIRECAAMGVKPWVCISYGNPVWGSDFRLGMRVKQVTDNPEAFAAWIRYVKALVTRYKDVVDEWEVWNEPFDQDEEYATLYLETAKAVRSVQPEAKLFCTAVGFPKGYVAVIEKLRAANAPDLVDRFICHPYVPNPDATYEKGEGPCVWQPALRLRELVKSYSPRYDILQGEVGCPSQLEFAHALANIEWTEYAQAKWDLRRAIGDRVRDIPSNLFTFIDLQYTFMLQSFGLVRSNTLKEPVYRRPSYFAMQNVYSYFDDNVYPVGVEKREVGSGGGERGGGSEGSAGKGAVRKELTVAKFERRGTPIHVVWFSGERPGDSLAYERADLSFIRDRDRLAWVDLMTGRICKLPDVKSVPVWDSPVMIVPTWEVERRGNIALTGDWLNVEYAGGGWDRAAGLHVAIDGREEFVLECTIGGEPRHWAALDVRNFRGKTAKVEMRAPGTWEHGTLGAVESAATPREGALKFCPRSQCRALDVVLPRPADGRFLLVPVRRQAPPVTCDFWDGTNLLFDLRVRLAVDGEPDYLASVPLEDFAADTVRCSTDDPVVPAADYAACVRRFAVVARPPSVTTPTDGTFAAPYGGTGDMVGFFRLNGRYHIGFLHDYAGDIWNENCCWSHASSDDLVHWRIEKPFDRKGKGVKRSSGCCFVDAANRSGLGDGRTPPVLLFGCIESGIAQRYQIKSGTARQTRPDLIPTLTMKYSRDGGKTFVDHPKPILRMQDIGGHDPEIIYHRQSDSFVMVLHDRRDGTWGFDFYTSTNLLDWTYASTVKGLWETPNFFPLAVEETGEEKWVLMQCDLRYYVGSFDGRVFTPETPLRPPLFADSFAPRTVQADDGRRILMAARLGANGATRPVVLRLRSENGQLQVSYNPLNT